MLKLMRDYASSWLIKVILGVIVIVFVFWGVGSFRAQKGGRAALVNGDSVTVEEYKSEYNNLIEQFRQKFGNKLNDEMLQMLQIKKQALNRLIDKKLLLQEAEKLSFRVTSEELAAAVGRIKAFQKSGVFDKSLYKSILSRYGLAPEEFELNQKEFMIIEKLRGFLLGSVMVSDGEAMEWFKWGNVSVNLDYVLFEPGRYKDINSDDEEIKAFFAEHKENYKTEPMVKVDFLHFNPDNYNSKINITDKKINDYYESHQEEFKKYKTVEARHILIKVDKDAGEEAVEKAKNKILGILQMIKDGKNFADMAKKYSDCPSKENGGSLGAFRREAMVKPFADKAFSMESGEISQPVRTMFGWHIIKVEKINEEMIVTFDEAKDKIRSKLIYEGARTLAYDDAESLFDTVVDGDSLAETAGEKKIKLQATDFFTADGPVKGIEKHREFASVAFGLSDMEISDIHDFGDGYYILQVIEKQSEKISELKDLKEKITADLIEHKQNKKANADANELLSGLKKGVLMSAEAAKYNLELKSTGFFKRNEPVPDIGSEKEIIETAFNLSDKMKLPENVIKGEKGYYVVRFKERKDADLKEFDKIRADIKEVLLSQKRTRFFDEWLTQIRNKSDISVEKEFFNQD